MFLSRGARRNSQLVSGERQMFHKSRSERYHYGVLSDRSRRTEHMTVSADMPQIGTDMRPIRAERSRAGHRSDRMACRRRQEICAVKCIDRSGMRASAALWLVVGLCVLLGVMTLMHEAQIAEAGISTTRTEQRLKEAQNKVAALQVEYSAATADVDQAKIAAAHGYISSKGLRTIQLYGPENAIYSPSEVPPRLPRDSLATILGE